MSKVGRKPIIVESSQNIQVRGLHEIAYKGKYASGTYVLPEHLKAEIHDKNLTISLVNFDGSFSKEDKMVLGLHRSRLANILHGSENKFVRELKINGLGFKAVMIAGKLQFALGYSHKIDYSLPVDVTVEIDKTGQILILRSVDKEKLGLVCSQIRALRRPEPYKGTGIQYANEVIRRKAGKTK